MDFFSAIVFLVIFGVHKTLDGKEAKVMSGRSRYSIWTMVIIVCAMLAVPFSLSLESQVKKSRDNEVDKAEQAHALKVATNQLALLLAPKPAPHLKFALTRPWSAEIIVDLTNDFLTKPSIIERNIEGVVIFPVVDVSNIQFEISVFNDSAISTLPFDLKLSFSSNLIATPSSGWHELMADDRHIFIDAGQAPKTNRLQTIEFGVPEIKFSKAGLTTPISFRYVDLNSGVVDFVITATLSEPPIQQAMFRIAFVGTNTELGNAVRVIRSTNGQVIIPLPIKASR